MTQVPSPGAQNIPFLTGSEIVPVLAGSVSAQTTTAAIAGLGLALGNAYFVNETTGSDSNVGSRAAPFATLTAALAAATANHGDVIYLEGTVHVTATVAWNKNGVSLIGTLAPSDNDRARISSSGSTVFSPLVNVTGVGCSFINVGTFHGFNDASAQVCWAEAGGRNFYSNVQFLGMGDATAAAQAGSRSLTVAGSGENLFVGCTIGLDTVTRATNANASLEFLAGTARNTFRSCIFQALVSDASDTHVTVAAGGMDRYALFDDCTFINCVDSTATAMSAAITNAGGSPSGSILLNDCIFLGATAVATTGAVYVNQISAAGATTTFIALHAT